MFSVKEEVESFLQTLKVKLDVFGVVFLERDKNMHTLLSLELTTINRKDFLKELTPEDYCRGPIDDDFNEGGGLWEFGKTIKGQEVYIKIQFGKSNRPVICISFHLAEFSLKYQFKNN